MKIFYAFLFFLGTLNVSAQSLNPDTHCADSIMNMLEKQYGVAQYYNKNCPVEQQSLVVRQYGPLKVNPYAVDIPGVCVADPPSLFADEDERRWMYEDRTWGEEIFHGVLNILSDVLDNGKKKKR